MINPVDGTDMPSIVPMIVITGILVIVLALMFGYIKQKYWVKR